MLHLAGSWPGAKSLLNVKSCISPTGPDRTTTTWISVTRPDQCPEGQKMFVRLPNVPDVAHNLPVGSRLNPFWELLVPSYCPSIHKSKVHFNNSFSYDAPKLWNDLPYDIRSAPNLSSFKSRLKTYLFQKSFPP